MPETEHSRTRGGRGGNTQSSHRPSDAARRDRRCGQFASLLLVPAVLLLTLASGISALSAPLSRWWIDAAFFGACAGTIFWLFRSMTSAAKRSIEEDPP